jgi:hypothetical protein
MAKNVVLPPNSKFKVEVKAEVEAEDDPKFEVPDAEFDESPPDLSELSMSVRIDLAYQAWIKYEGTIPARKIARSHGVANFTLHDRINGVVSKYEAS